MFFMYEQVGRVVYALRHGYFDKGSDQFTSYFTHIETIDVLRK